MPHPARDARAAADFAHKAHLLAAEKARLLGRDVDALHLYERAADSAVEHGLRHVQALALERLGRFARARGWPRLALEPLREARDLYRAWSAWLKVEHLTTEFPQLRRQEPGAVRGEDPTASSSSAFDMASVVKTSQAISEETRLDLVVERVMAAAIENAGAQRGVLLSPASAGIPS